MSICMLTHLAAFDPEEAKRRILDTADGKDYKTRPTALALGVSYPTLLRPLDRLDIKETFRDRWATRKKDNRAKGLRV